MFSENRKISLRQTYRLFVFDLLGVGTLLLPTQLAGSCGTDGIWCILLGGAFGFLYLLLLGRTLKVMRMDVLTYTRLHLADGLRKGLLLYLIVYSILFGGFCSYVFAELIQKSLIPEESFVLILGLLVVVSAYAVSGGMESRARVYEILFWFVLIPLVVMLFAAARDVEPSFWLPLFTAEAGNLWQGSYLVFCALSVMFYLLFFPACVKENDQKKLVGYAGAAMAIMLVILGALYLILVGSFGAEALSHMRFPAVTLMSTVQVKGNFLKRTDALMLGVWFFTLFALLNLHVYYASKMAQELAGKKKRATHDAAKRAREKNWYIAGTAAAIFLAALLFEYGDEMMRRYLKMLQWIGIPMLVLIPAVILLTGCNSTELEDRCFPMLAAVDYDKNSKEVLFSYMFPRAGIKSEEGQNAAQIDLSPVKEGSFQEAKKEFEREVSKKPDPNHLKIVLLGKAFVENRSQYENLLEELQKEEDVPRNTYVCITSDVKAVLEQDEHRSMDIGSYLEELLENHDRNKNKKLPTIGSLMDEKDNQRRTIAIPYIEIENDTIVWQTEYLMKKGIAAGIKEGE